MGRLQTKTQPIPAIGSSYLQTAMDRLKLRYMERWNRIVEEERAALRALENWASSGGHYDGSHDSIVLEHSEKRVLAVVEEARQMLELGHINPTENSFKQTLVEVKSVVDSQKHSLPARLKLASERSQMALSISGMGIRARMQLQRIFEDEAQRRSRAQSSAGLQIGAVNVTGVVNLQGTIGSITQHISGIQQRDPAVGEALRVLTKVAERLEGDTKREAIEALSDLAEEAEKQPRERRLSRVRGSLIHLPGILNASPDMIQLVDKYLPVIQAYFNLP